MTNGEALAGPETGWDYSLITRMDGEPLYDSGWKPRILEVNGKKVEAHETNNLFINIILAKNKREELRINPTAPMLGRTHDFYFRQGALSIFSIFEDHHVDLYAHLMDIYQRLSQKDGANLDLYTERDIFCSVAFECLARIAIAQMPGFDIRKLTV